MKFITRPALALVATLSLPVLAQEAAQGTGFYVGASLGAAKAKAEGSVALGGAWSSESASLRSDVVSAWSKDLDRTAFLGGLQVGYRYQHADGFMLAGELHLDFMSAKKTLATGPVATASFPTLTYAYDSTVETKTPLSLEVKLGYAYGAHTPYLTLGYARAKVEASSQITSNGGYLKAGSGSESKGGFQWGLGYDFRFDRNWSGLVQVTTANLGNLEYTTNYLPGSAFTSPAYTESFKQKMTLTTFRVGVNYTF